MPETVDPRQALSSDDVTVRAAAARELAEVGTVADALRLIDLAQGDKSPSVRLYAAAGAAEIVFRAGLDPAHRQAVLDRMKSYDPGRNPALLMVLAAIPDDAGVERLGRLLRDPRSDVRSGAFASLKRMATVPGTDTLLSAAVRRWFEAGKHPPDTVADLVRLTSEAGWAGMDDTIRAAASRGRAAAIAVQEAIDWLVSRNDPRSWIGLWVRLDEDPITRWLYLERGIAWGPEGELGALTVSDAIGAIAGRDGSTRGPLVRVRTGRPTDDEPAEALKVGDDGLLHHQSARGLVKLIDKLDGVFRGCPTAALGVARILQPLEGAAAVRGRATALIRGGALREAETLLDVIVAADKKPKPDVAWLVANVKLGLGDLDSAREALRECLKNAPKKAAYRPEAEALLESLRG